MERLYINYWRFSRVGIAHLCINAASQQSGKLVIYSGSVINVYSVSINSASQQSGKLRGLKPPTGMHSSRDFDG